MEFANKAVRLTGQYLYSHVPVFHSLGTADGLILQQDKQGQHKLHKVSYLLEDDVDEVTYPKNTSTF